MLKLCFLIILFEFSSRAISFDYENYKVYDIIPSNGNQSDLLHELSKSDEKYDFWGLSRIPGRKARVMVSPEYQNEFEDILTSSNINFSISIKDMSRSIKLERINNKRKNLSRDVNFDRYLRFDEINEYLDTLAEKHSKNVIVQNMGKSYEGRDIKGIYITSNIDETNKNLIFIDAGIHAREWIAPATAVYVIQQLVEKFEENEHLFKNFNWLILPLVNPDGYEYCHTTERLWRKTRKPNYKYVGTDGNRNFDYHWGEVGTSWIGSSDIYQGPSPFSEPETVIIRDILNNTKPHCKFYLTLHSFGRYLLYPWGFTSALPDTWADIDRVAQIGARAIRQATGSEYTIGSSTNVMYPAAGGSDDYAHGVMDVPIAMTMELPPEGEPWFDPEPKEIKGMVEESWIGIKAMAEEVIRKYS